jgi:signal transduction histidine kinase
MAGAYAYNPTVWLPLAAAILLAAVGLYSWHRRDVAGARWLAIGSFLGCLVPLGVVLEATAVLPAAKIAGQAFQAAFTLPSVAATTCFALDYASAGRWLTRRNLALVWTPAILGLLAIVITRGEVLGPARIAADGTVEREASGLGCIFLAYAIGLFVANTAAFLWLFARSPQHRWPVALVLAAQLAGRGAFVINFLSPDSPVPFDLVAGSTLLVYTVYAIALFGFRIFDPLPAARLAVLEQMHAGVVVFDAGWRVLSLNPAAARLLGTAAVSARGKGWDEVLPTGSPPPELLRESEPAGGESIDLPEMTQGSGDDAAHYAPNLSELRDFRGPLLGYLLLLRDVTAQRRAQTQIVQQQRALAVLEERERLARELHDSIGQVLAAAHLQAKSARRWLQQGQNAQVDETLALLADTTLEAETDVRDYLLGAKTMMSTERPFFPSLREYLLRFSRQYALPIELAVPSDLEGQGLPTAVEVQLFRIIQEALSNVRKHAQARCARVAFSQHGGQLEVAILDDGRGFDLDTVQMASYGLQAMAGRATAVGGNLTVLSEPRQGTQVLVRLPTRETREMNP